MDGWTDILIQSDTEHKALWSWHYGQYKQVGGAACAGVRHYSDLKKLVQMTVQLSCIGIEIKMRMVTGRKA